MLRPELLLIARQRGHVRAPFRDGKRFEHRRHVRVFGVSVVSRFR